MPSNIQLFGTKKCFDTKKAQRFFKERGVKFQFIDLKIKGMSKGEIESVSRVVGLRNMLDSKHPMYLEKHLDRISTPGLIIEILLDYPEILKTPIVRCGKEATIGDAPEIWARFI